MLLERYGLKEPNRKGGSQENCDNQESAYITLYESIEKAKHALLDAKQIYNEATEDDYIDSLIHRINACEREYMHLLKLARRESISVFPDIK